MSPDTSSRATVVATVTLVDRPHLIQAITTLDTLHSTVNTSSWAVVGGLMVQLLCAEAGVDGARVTDDTDLAVDVFSDRASLKGLTGQLRQMGFVDGTPDSTTGHSRMSYRWIRDGLKFDLMVPKKANRQRSPARTVTGKPAVEFGGVQQAVSRSEVVEIRVRGTSVTGQVRRPNIVGAIVIKSVAGVADTRDTRRHWEDLVLLGQICANRGDLPEIRNSLTPADRRRICRVQERIPSSMFSGLDGQESREVLKLLGQAPRGR